MKNSEHHVAAMFWVGIAACISVAFICLCTFGVVRGDEWKNWPLLVYTAVEGWCAMIWAVHTSIAVFRDEPKSGDEIQF